VIAIEIDAPPDVIWWEWPASAQEVIDDLELGPRVHHCFGIGWTHVQGTGWVDQ